MNSSVVVFYKVGTTCLLLFVGYLFRRMKILPENSVSFISKYMVYMALPAYLIYYMPASISPETLALYWHYPFIGALLVGAADLFGWLTARVWARPDGRPTFRMLVAFPNWVFMALAVCEPLFHAEGIRMVLLYNIGIMFYIWTFGMTGFRPAVGAVEILGKLFLNTQTVAMMLGLVVALCFPFVRGMEKMSSLELSALPLHIGLVSPFWDTVSLISSTTMPLAILQIGMMLGGVRSADSIRAAAAAGAAGRGTRTLVIVSALRLLAAPLLAIGVQAALFGFGMLTDRAEFVSSAIIMAMPVATLCFTIAEVHGGASRLAARAVLWSTLASLLTAPVATWVAETVYKTLL